LGPGSGSLREGCDELEELDYFAALHFGQINPVIEGEHGGDLLAGDLACGEFCADVAAIGERKVGVFLEHFLDVPHGSVVDHVAEGDFFFAGEAVAELEERGGFGHDFLEGKVGFFLVGRDHCGYCCVGRKGDGVFLVDLDWLPCEGFYLAVDDFEAAFADELAPFVRGNDRSGADIFRFSQCGVRVAVDDQVDAGNGSGELFGGYLSGGFFDEAEVSDRDDDVAFFLCPEFFNHCGRSSNLVGEFEGLVRARDGERAERGQAEHADAEAVVILDDVCLIEVLAVGAGNVGGNPGEFGLGDLLFDERKVVVELVVSEGNRVVLHHVVRGDVDFALEHVRKGASGVDVARVEHEDVRVCGANAGDIGGPFGESALASVRKHGSVMVIGVQNGQRIAFTCFALDCGRSCAAGRRESGCGQDDGCCDQRDGALCGFVHHSFHNVSSI